MRFVALETEYIAVIIVVVMVWLACAMYCGGIARNNGSSYSVWFFLGVIGGPLALGVACVHFMMSGERHRRVKYSEGKAGNLPEIVQCPGCRQSVPSSFDTCQFCGEPLHGGRRR